MNTCSAILFPGWARSVTRAQVGLLSRLLLFYSTRTSWNTSLGPIEGKLWSWRLPEPTSAPFLLASGSHRTVKMTINVRNI